MYTHIIDICPHCGGEGKIKGRKRFRVICKNCGAQGPIKPTSSQAVKAWNRSNTKEQTDG